MTRPTVSYWADQLAEQQLVRVEPPLQRDLRVDVLIVGGGYAGLSTALAIAAAAPDKRVALTEAQRIGFGASGRNAGILSPLSAPSWLLPGALPGKESAWALAELSRRAHDVLREFESLDGGPSAATLHLAAPSAFMAQGLRWLSERLSRSGIASELLSASQLRERTGEQARVGLALATSAIHPARFAAALKQRVLQAGVSVFEQTRVERIEPAQSHVLVCTETGVRIEAKHVVLAVGAWGPTTPFRQKGKVYQTYMLASAPLSPTQLAQLGGEQTLVGSVSSGLSYRRVHQGRLLFGGLDDVARAPLPAGLVPDTVVPRLRALLKKSLPEFAEVPVATVWGGAFHVASLSDLPRLQRWKSSRRVMVWAGSAGAGVLWCLLAGQLMRGLIDQRLEHPADRRLREAVIQSRLPVLSVTSAWSHIALRTIAAPAAP